jgi:hypothetical protein
MTLYETSVLVLALIGPGLVMTVILLALLDSDA